VKRHECHPAWVMEMARTHLRARCPCHWRRLIDHTGAARLLQSERREKGLGYRNMGCIRTSSVSHLVVRISQRRAETLTHLC